MVGDVRTEITKPVAEDEDCVFVHLAFTESSMTDGFPELIKKDRLFPVFLGSSGDKQKDHLRAQALPNVLNLGCQDVFWQVLCNEMENKKKE